MILFIDDEHRGVKPYIEELQFSGYEVKFKDNIDDALDFYKNKQEKLT